MDATIESTIKSVIKEKSSSNKLSNENIVNKLWHSITEKLPLWKKQTQNQPDGVINEISNLDTEVTADSVEVLEQPLTKKVELSHILSNNETSLDHGLDLFEKYISEMTTPNILETDDSNNKELLIGPLANLVKKDKSLDISVNTINQADYSPDNPLVKNLSNRLKTDLKSIYTRNGRDYDIEIPNDPKLIRFWQALDSYHNKEIQLLEEKGLIDKEIPIPGVDESNRHLVPAEYLKTYRQVIEESRKDNESIFLSINDILYERRLEGKIVVPETFLGHGTSFENFQKMIAKGKLQSPWFAQRSGDPNLGIRTIGLDPGAIFTYSDKNRDGAFAQYSDLHREADLGFIFRMDKILEKGYSIGSKNGTDSKSEYFITSTPEAFSTNDLTIDQRVELAKKDTTELDLKDSYIRISNQYINNKTVELLKSSGFDDSWIKEHVVFFENSAPIHKITDWLKTRSLPPIEESQKTIKYSPVEAWQDNYYIWKAQSSSEVSTESK